MVPLCNPMFEAYLDAYQSHGPSWVAFVIRPLIRACVHIYIYTPIYTHIYTDTVPKEAILLTSYQLKVNSDRQTLSLNPLTLRLVLSNNLKRSAWH